MKNKNTLAKRHIINDVETQPLLHVPQPSTESPSFIQSWKDVLEEARSSRRLWSVTMVATVSGLSAVVSGYAMGYPSSTLVELDRLDAFPKGSVLAGLFGALVLMGAAVGGGVAGYFADVFGRKPGLLASSVPNTVGWLLLATAHCWTGPETDGFKALMLVGQFSTGMSMGWSMTASSIYNGEVAPAALRGIFNPTVLLAFGLLLAFITGWLTWFTYIRSALLALGLTALYTALVFFIPETPPYLIKKGRLPQAACVLTWLRGSHERAISELKSIQTVTTTEESNESMLDLIKKKGCYVSCLLLLVIMSFPQLSGINALVFYSDQIAADSGFKDPTLVSLLTVGLSEFLAYLPALALCDLFGRKMMFVLSSGMMMVSCIMLGLYFYFINCCHHHYNTMAIVAMVIFVVGFALGLGPLPFLVMTELLPLKVRGALAGVATAILWSWGALVTGFYSKYADFVGDDKAWYTFAGFNLFAIVFVSIFLPETKGKKMETIEHDMNFKYRLCVWK